MRAEGQSFKFLQALKLNDSIYHSDEKAVACLSYLMTHRVGVLWLISNYPLQCFFQCPVSFLLPGWNEEENRTAPRELSYLLLKIRPFLIPSHHVYPLLGRVGLGISSMSHDQHRDSVLVTSQCFLYLTIFCHHFHSLRLLHIAVERRCLKFSWATISWRARNKSLCTGFSQIYLFVSSTPYSPLALGSLRLPPGVGGGELPLSHLTSVP